MPPQQGRQEPQRQLPPDVCSNEAWHEALGQRPPGQMQTQVPSRAPTDEEASRRLRKRSRQGKRTEL